MTIAPLAVKLAGPSGYCIDPETVQQNRQRRLCGVGELSQAEWNDPQKICPTGDLNNYRRRIRDGNNLR